LRIPRQFLQKITGGADGQGIDWLAYLVLVAGVTLWFLFSPVTNGALHLVLRDPDNYLRLVEVRDWLGGQSWWNTNQYRINPPDGLKMHWSRLADVPLGLAILLFSMVFESRTAETLALVCVPPLLLLFTAVFLGRAAKNVGGAPAETWARLLLVSAIFVLLQYIPGRVDHHGLQLLLLSGALMAATSKPTRQSGLIVALPTSISLLVGLENVPLLLAILGWIAFTWLWEGRDRQAQLEGFAVGIIVFLPALYALSVAPSDWSRPTYDEIGRGHIAVVVASGLALAAALWTKPPSLGWRMAALGLAAIVAALPLLAFPEVLSPPYAAIDPVLQTLWIDAISETKSAKDIAAENPFKLIEFYLFSSLALIAGTALYLTSGRPPKLLLVLLVSLCGLALSLWQVRGMTSASLTAVLLSAIVGSHFWNHRSRRFGWAYVAAAIVLLNGWTGSLLVSAIAPESDKASAGSESANEMQCENQLRDANLDRVPRGLVLSVINSGSVILARTSHSVLAASNHRAIEGNRIAYRIFLSPTLQARAELVRNGIDYVLICEGSEQRRLAGLAPNGFAADLQAGRIPDWLTPIPHGAGQGLGFYVVASETPRNAPPSR
jgi:hypothetical protein